MGWGQKGKTSFKVANYPYLDKADSNIIFQNIFVQSTDNTMFHCQIARALVNNQGIPTWILCPKGE